MAKKYHLSVININTVRQERG